MDYHVEVKRYALLIGVSYETSETGPSTSNEISPQRSLKRSTTEILKGSHNDVRAVRKLLTEVFGYREEDIILMTDEPSTDLTLVPTRTNIIDQLQNFIHPDEPNARYFFLYAGHSRQLPCEDDTEEDGLNECIVPSDAFDIFILTDRELEDMGNAAAADKLIVDDILHKYLVHPIKQSKTSRLTAVFDTCHSGTLLDLDHYRCNRYARRFTAIKRRVHRRFNELLAHLRRFQPPVLREVAHDAHHIASVYPKRVKHKFCKGNDCLRPRGQSSVICISACKDREITLEETMGQGNGLLTLAFTEALRKDHNPKLKHLMRCISSEVDKHVKKAKKSSSWQDLESVYAQNPQFSSDIPADMSLPLDM
ncbi:peptidase C14 [Dendrothele bispora CBS 962.96]|uniref:Peptidase C14 n=1 Tax=Dendrothele bispora (strain CBS 962.96) TaxID=1314807 RepID=A0A4S8M7N5_DENBC|nr:peptidase C14 [Dendrothele bispora CBS 962.96]